MVLPALSKVRRARVNTRYFLLYLSDLGIELREKHLKNSCQPTSIRTSAGIHNCRRIHPSEQSQHSTTATPQYTDRQKYCNVLGQTQHRETLSCRTGVKMVSKLKMA